MQTRQTFCLKCSSFGYTGLYKKSPDFIVFSERKELGPIIEQFATTPRTATEISTAVKTSKLTYT
jgi:hypothetical protein